MRQAVDILRVQTVGRGLVEITDEVAGWVRGQAMSTGLLTLFCRHTSASLIIQENAAPEVRQDLEAFFEAIAPEDPSRYAHDDEGPDDMPAHLRSALTGVQLSVPLIAGRLALGTWQGIYLFEHRRRPHAREVALHLLGTDGVSTYIEIYDPADPRIEPYRDIRERDLVGRRGLFVAEGEVVLRHLVQSSRFRAVSVLIDAKRREKLSPMLATLPDATPVYHAPQTILDGVVGFPIHRGILAIGAPVQAPSPAELLATVRTPAVVLALFGIANHDNIGGIFRNAAAFGVQAILLDPHCCDPLYRKALRVSVGAGLIVPFAKLAPGDDALDLLQTHGFDPLALTPAGEVRLADVQPGERSAVLLGAEGPGLSPELIARATGVRIPMASGFDSLNVATTSGIVLHHLATFLPCEAGEGDREAVEGTTSPPPSD